MPHNGFLVDQAQQLGCQLFQMALKKSKRKLYFWETVRNYFFICVLPSWEALYNAIVHNHEGILRQDTS
jgi:hypothetical protein